MEIGRGRQTLTIIINKSQPEEQEAAASSSSKQQDIFITFHSSDSDIFYSYYD
jgi:hypothetical protein